MCASIDGTEGPPRPDGARSGRPAEQEQQPAALAPDQPQQGLQVQQPQIQHLGVSPRHARLDRPRNARSAHDVLSADVRTPATSPGRPRRARSHGNTSLIV